MEQGHWGRGNWAPAPARSWFSLCLSHISLCRETEPFPVSLLICRAQCSAFYMQSDHKRQEINLKRLLAAAERLASSHPREFAAEAAAATSASKESASAIPYKSSYVITTFKKVRLSHANVEIPLFSFMLDFPLVFRQRSDMFHFVVHRRDCKIFRFLIKGRRRARQGRQERCNVSSRKLESPRALT